MSDNLLCLFSARVEEKSDKYVIEVPRREIEAETVSPNESYRVALLDHLDDDEQPQSSSTAPDQPQPPVEIGETRYLEIEDLGKQGDGIARVERGYVIIVPNTDVGDRVKVEITEVKPNFAVAEVIEPEPVS